MFVLTPFHSALNKQKQFKRFIILFRFLLDPILYIQIQDQTFLKREFWKIENLIFRKCQMVMKISKHSSSKIICRSHWKIRYFQKLQNYRYEFTFDLRVRFNDHFKSKLKYFNPKYKKLLRLLIWILWAPLDAEKSYMRNIVQKFDFTRAEIAWVELKSNKPVG